MKISRLLLYTLALLLLLVAASGAYLYPRLPALVAQQAETYLADYGVSDVELGALQPSASVLRADYLQLSGAVDGLDFELVLEGIEIRYELAALWRGQIDSLAVRSARATLAETASATAGQSSAVVLSALAPQGLLARLPLQELQLSHWQLSYRPLQGDPVPASGSLRWAQGSMTLPFASSLPEVQLGGELVAGPGRRIELRASAMHGELAIGRLTLSGAPQATQGWLWRAQGELAPAPLLAWLRQSAMAEQPALAALDLAGFSQFEAELQHPDELLLPGGNPAAFLAQFAGELGASHTLTRVAYGEALQGGVGAVETRLALAGGELELMLGPGQLDAQLGVAALGLPEDMRHWLRWQQAVPLRWRESAQTRLRRGGDGAWTLTGGHHRLLLGERTSQLKLDAPTLQVSLQGQRSETSVAATVDVRLRQQQLPQMRLAIEQRGTLQASDIGLRLGDTADSLALAVDGEFSAGSGQGAFLARLDSLDLPYAASVAVPLLQKFGLLRQPLAIDSGSFKLASELSTEGYSPRQWQQQARLQITDVAGSYGEYRFDGIEVNARWQGIEQWQTLEPAHFSAARLNVGFDISDTRAVLVLPEATPPGQPVVRLDALESGMFGGRVFLPAPQRWDFGRQANSITLRAEDWRLADLVALQQGQEIQAQGILEGELPVTVSGGRILIDKGYLRARAPGGSIRYVANAASRSLAQSSPELGLALGLLEDFRYNTLSSAVELDRDGNLLLGLSLEGSNPAHYEGRTIRFNINLEQNIDPLLQSLRLSDSLVEKVEQGLR